MEEGQGLVVIEAMKMENEIKSPKAGKVVELHVKEGTDGRGKRQALRGGVKRIPPVGVRGQVGWGVVRRGLEVSHLKRR